MAKTSCKKGQYYCNTDKKCKPIPEGYTVREDGFLVKEGWSAKYKKSIDCNNPKGFSQKAHCAGKKKKMTEESNPRIARKKGQPAKSKKHSDLYTDEDPKGTIHGLGFKDVATAKASVAKIRKSGRSHAHKIQAAIAMEQRARVMGKTSEAAVYRKFINSMKKKTKAMNEEKHGDHEYEMIRRQADNIMVNAKKLKKKVGKGEGNAKAWVQSKITKAADYLDTAADYMTDKESVKEGTLRSWFKGSKSKDGKGGWVNVKTGGTCASDEPGEGVPKCVSRAKYDSMSKKERESAHRRKRAADPNQQSKTGAAKPTYVSTDKPKKKKKMKEEFVSLPLQLEIPQNDGEFKLGLMFRESLEQDRGMLFIFESNDYWTFHMKNTFIPLDIAFIKEDGTIDSIKELDPMSPVPVYPESEIRYAVEVNRGWFAENDVNVGDALLEDIQEHHKKDADGNTIPHEHEEELNEVKDRKGKGSGTKDACYYKVKSRYSVWPSAYASGALVKCRKVGAANWGNSKKEEVEYEYEVPTNGHYSWRDSLNEGEELDEMDGKLMPSNPKFKGVGATKKSNPFPQGKQKARVFTEPQRMLVNTQTGKVSGSDLTPKEYAKKNFPSAETTKKELKKTYDKEVPYYDSRGPSTLTQLKGKEGKFIKIDDNLRNYHNKRVVATAGKGSKDKDKYKLDYSKGSKLANLRKKEVNMKEQALNMAQRRAARGSSYKAPTPKPQPKPTPQAKPDTPTPQATQASPAPQAKPLSNKSPAAKAGIPLSMRQAAADRNAKFQAAKKSGNLSQFRKDNPKMSGRERAQAMAKARIASRNAQSASPTPTKPTVDKVPPAAQAKPAPQAKPTANTVTKPAPQAPATPQGGQGGKAQDALNRRTTPQKPQDALNRNPVQKPVGTPASASKKIDGAALANTMRAQNNQSGSAKTVNVGGKDVDLSKVGPGMRKRLLQKNVGTNAAKEVQKVNPKPGQTVNVKQDPKTGSVSSKVTGKGVPTKDTKFATDKLLNTNRTDGKKYSASDAERMQKSFNKRLQSEPDFDEFDNVPVVNSKGKKVKKIPGTNSMPTGGSNKSVNANLDSF